MGQIKMVGTLLTGPGGMYSDIYMDDKITRCPERLSLNGTDKKKVGTLSTGPGGHSTKRLFLHPPSSDPRCGGQHPTLRLPGL